MKQIHVILSVFLLCFYIQVSAQNPILNSYKLGEGITFSDKEKSSITLSGFIQPFMEIRSYNTDSALDSYTRFRMRRLRFRIAGDLPKYKISYRFQADLSGTPEVGDSTGNSLFDAWVAYTPISNVEIKFGQSSNFTENREILMSSNSLQLVERSRLTSAFAVPREVGLFISTDFKIGNSFFVEPNFSITNGDGGNVMGNDFGGFKYGARIDFTPFGKFVNLGKFRQGDHVRELTPKLIFGVNFSYIDGVSSRRGEASGTILYLNRNMETSLPNYRKMGADFLFKYQGFSLLGEFMNGHASVPNNIVFRVRENGTITNSFDIEGRQDMPNYIRNRMIIGSVYNIQGGYNFKRKFSIDARFTHFDAAQYSFLNNNTIYNRPNYYTIGITKFFSRNHGLKIQAAHTMVKAGSGALDIKGNAIKQYENVTHVMATYSF
jgi:hypothetical protein